MDMKPFPTTGQLLKRKDGAIFRVQRDDEGVGIVPYGGGFLSRLQGSPKYLEDFEAFEPDNTIPLTKAKFGIDEWGPFEGYWIEWDRWNGWAKPLFPPDSVIKIARSLESQYKGSPDENGFIRGIFFGYPPSTVDFVEGAARQAEVPVLLIADYNEPNYWETCGWSMNSVQEGDIVKDKLLCDICTSNWCWEEWFCGLNCNNCYMPEGECKCQGPKDAQTQ